MPRVLVGASEGLHAFEDGQARPVEPIGWDGSPTAVTALARDRGDLFAIVGQHEIWRSSGDGWSHVVTAGDLGLACIAATHAGVVVGTEGAHLALLAEPPTPLRTLETFDRVEGRDAWYTPWGGPPATRSIAHHGGSIYVNVHVGGIVRSRDGGASWEPTIDVDADVHRVRAGEPGVFAACALGLALSEDDGDTWRIEDDGLHSRYCRAVTVCGDSVLVSAADGPRGGRGAVYRRPLAGGSLQRCRTGLPEWFDGNVDSAWLDARAGLVALGTPDGRVFASTDEGESWEQVAAGLAEIHAVLVVP